MPRPSESPVRCLRKSRRAPLNSKLFNTSDMQIDTECQSIFNFRLPSAIIPDRCETFRVKYESGNSWWNKVVYITRYSSLLCPRCNICCFCNLNALFTVYFVSYIRLIILHIDCILVFTVYYFLFVFFLYRSLMNKVAQNIIKLKIIPHGDKLIRLNLSTLKYRRLRGDVFEVFKITHNT